jgi:chemotaxis protein CheD
MFMREIDRAGTAPGDYEAKVFGGGNQFPNHNSARPIDVPTRNIDAALRLMAGHGLHLTAQDVGGSGARQVVLDLATGHVWVRHRRILKLESSK